MSGTLQVGGVTLGTHNSGTGKIDLTNAGTLSLGSAASNALTLGTSTTFPAGHIIQVAQTRNGTYIVRTGNQSTWADTGVSCTFSSTLSAGSQIYAHVEGQMAESSGGHWGGGHYFTFYQNSTNICGNQITDPNTQGSYGKLALTTVGTDGSDNNYWRGNFSTGALFTPTGTDTAKKTVNLYWRYGTTASHSAYLNYVSVAASDNTGGATMLTLMEIAG